MPRTAMTIFAVLAAFLSLSAPAWCGTPSSANGIGVVIDDNLGRSKGMGGAGIAVGGGLSELRGNPALISTFKAPAYGFGFNYNRVATHPNGGGTINFAHTDPDYIKFVLPLYRSFTIGWSLSPISRTNVNIALESNPGDTFTDTASFDGGVNVSSFEIAAGYRSVYAGIGIDYYFGAIEEKWVRVFDSSAGLNNSTDFLNREFKGYGITFGMLAKPTRMLSLGFGYTTPTSMDMSLHFKPGNKDALDTIIGTGSTDLPAMYRMGLAATFSNRVSAAADLSLSEWAKAAKTLDEKAMYTNTYSFGAGVRFIPSTSPTAGYIESIPLTAGFRIGTLYYKSFPKIDTLREMALTFGVELPSKSGSGGLITSCEVGKRGDKNSNGWDETFVNVGISLSGLVK
jgi:hypothetical protein